MPIYEYVCQACGQQTEIIHKISDPPERKCPNCGKLKLTKLVSAAAFRLKGGGWYETDFKSDSDKKRNLTDGKDDAPPPAKDTETAKPAATPVAKKEAPKAKPVKKPAAAAKKLTGKKGGK